MAKKTITDQDIREGFPPRQVPKEDRYTKKIANVGFYEVYRNRKKGTFIFYATDYHTGPLIITKQGLEKLLSDLKPRK